ncbi:alpha/beta family hydrolase [Candidatus Rhodoblastus alkanivorans]|uniref:alpha/beta family hydrolase n=1 Tax=Candidatus Rhodoblastus alkanivorans TaxID=2954117 RepID=UPI0034E0A6BC
MAKRDIAYLLATGAGAPTSHPGMQSFRAMAESIGAVVPFDYSYALEGRNSPDRLPKLIESHWAALAALRERHAGPIVLVGKSMGGRVGCHVALAEPVLPCLRRTPSFREEPFRGGCPVAAATAAQRSGPVAGPRFPIAPQGRRRACGQAPRVGGRRPAFFRCS